MSGQELENFRVALLRVLDANRTRFGLGVPALGHLVMVYGFTAQEGDVIKDQVDYLCSKGLAEEVLKVVSRENRAWRITDQGTAFLDGRV